MFYLHLCRLMLMSVGPAKLINHRKCLSWSQRLLHLLEVNTTGKDCFHDLSVFLILDTLFNQFICMENDLPKLK